MLSRKLFIGFLFKSHFFSLPWLHFSQNNVSIYLPLSPSELQATQRYIIYVIFWFKKKKKKKQADRQEESKKRI